MGGGGIPIVSDIVEAGFDLAGNAVDTVGNIIDDQLGLDSLGNEVSNWGQDIKQVGGVLSGEYAERSAELQDKQEAIKSQINDYNTAVANLQDKASSLMAFHEIFQIAASNKLDEYVNTRGDELNKLIANLNAQITDLRNDFDFVVGLTEGPFIQKLVGSVLMIVGGIVNDLGSLVRGDINSDLVKRLVVDIIIVIAVILAIPSGGASMAAVAGFVLTVIGAFMTLDGMYANGAATGAIMSALDFLFNDVLNLDDLIGKDFDKFDKDNEDYAQMVMYTKIAIALAAIGTGIVSSSGSTAADTMSNAANFESKMGIASTDMPIDKVIENSAGRTTTTSYAGGAVQISSTNAMNNSTALGVKFSTYASLYKAYETASSVNDAVTANENYKALQEKLEEDRVKVEKAAFQLQTKNFVKSYKDMAYLQQDQQEYIDRYVWGMTAQNMYVDPYGTTPVANMRFTPDKDTRVMAFGFEDLFDTNKLAGSKGYFNSVIYG